jgi:hypothetical protein
MGSSGHKLFDQRVGLKGGDAIKDPSSLHNGLHDELQGWHNACFNPDDGAQNCPAKQSELRLHVEL